jgi:murein L,D-transpeptidase YcbB/YkuD
MMQSLDTLSAHGLDPAVYTAGGDSARDAWLLAATHLRRGVLDPETLIPRMTADLALAASLDAVPAESNAAAYSGALEALAPSSALYSALQTELQRQQYGQSTSKDPQVAAAAGTRIAKLLVSLEHLRWLPHETTPRRIYANIPTFEVIAVSGEKEVSRHVAIFGELDRQTPEFSESIDYLEFSPWWYVPASIARNEKLAQFQRDPGEIERLGYRILDSAGKRVNAAKIDWDTVSASDFPYRIRQAPGPSNALGQVKFMFPNSQSIYLHDTPDGGLFAQIQRAVSAGCIRVQDAVELSEWVLEETPGWDRKRIDAAINSRTATRAALSSPMSIHIVYLTAFPAADGTMAYAADIYGKDAEVLPALTGYTLSAKTRAVSGGSAK